MLVRIDGVQVYLDDSGAGEPVLLLHAAASSGVQWQKIKMALNPGHRVLIPDLLGEGRTPGRKDWSGLLEAEGRLIRALIESTGGPVHVVGHSYGGVVAMRLALQFPHLFSSLILIEPVAFHLLTAYPRNQDYTELMMVKEACRSALEGGDALSAARCFVAYWSGEQAWNSLPEPVRHLLASGMEKVVWGWEAITADSRRLNDFRCITAPTIMVSGDRSPLPIQWVARQLAATIPAAKFVQVGNAGHMSPITHGPEIIRIVQSHVESAAKTVRLWQSREESLWRTEAVPDASPETRPPVASWSHLQSPGVKR
ncbi:MAG: alpha/beta fold hydrolase [Thermodesulfobacteriota bacterium]